MLAFPNKVRTHPTENPGSAPEDETVSRYLVVSELVCSDTNKTLIVLYMSSLSFRMNPHSDNRLKVI